MDFIVYELYHSKAGFFFFLAFINCEGALPSYDFKSALNLMQRWGWWAERERRGIERHERRWGRGPGQGGYQLTERDTGRGRRG